MRSEKEVKEKIESYTAGREASAFKSNTWITYDACVSALEWVLTESQPEPLTPIELRELRALLTEHRKKVGYPGTAGGSGLRQAPMGRS